MKAVRFAATNPDSPMSSTMMYQDPMTKVMSIPSTETTLKRCPIKNTFNIVGKSIKLEIYKIAPPLLIISLLLWIPTGVIIFLLVADNKLMWHLEHRE